MRVRWTEPAAADLTQISDYTQEHFGTTRARRTALAILNAAESLAKQSSRGRPGRRGGTRELLVPGLPFLIIYRIGDNATEILRILHGARKWPEAGRSPRNWP
jgi:plasmid stabilization system protein ParE